MDIVEQGASIGWDLEPYIERKELAILNAGAYLSSLSSNGKDRQVDVQKAVSDLAGFVNQIGAERMVLDPAGPFVLLRDSAARIQDHQLILTARDGNAGRVTPITGGLRSRRWDRSASAPEGNGVGHEPVSGIARFVPSDGVGNCVSGVTYAA